MFCWNFTYLIAVSASYSYMDTDCYMLPYPSTVVAAETMVFIFTMCFFGGVKAAMRTQVRQEIEASMARGESSALTAILNTMSDAVVELDLDLKIVGGSDQLACMLLRGQQGRSLAGVPFVRFAATDEDATHFEGRLKWKPEVPSLAEAFHMKVRDGLSNTIDVEIFHVCKSQHWHNSHHHLIGIREYTEQECFHLHGLSSDQPLRASFSCSDGGSSSHDLASMTEVGPGHRIEVIFEALSFELISISQGFVDFCGVKPSSSCFKDWFSARSLTSGLLADYMYAVNELMHGKEPDECTISQIDACVRVPISTSAKLEFTSRVTITFPTSSYVEEECLLATASFSDIKDQRLKVKHGHRSRRTTSGRSAKSCGSGRARTHPSSQGLRDVAAAPVSSGTFAQL